MSGRSRAARTDRTTGSEGRRQDRSRPTLSGARFEALARQTLAQRPAVGLALGVIRDDRLALFHGHGLADIASRTPITEDTVFRIGSVTKLFTAIAVLQLWERHTVDLDAPASDDLRAYRLVPADPASVRRPCVTCSPTPRAPRGPGTGRPAARRPHSVRRPARRPV